MIRAHRVVFLPDARRDLRRLRRYISSQAGARVSSQAGARVGNRYAREIVDACGRLATFPDRGSKQDDVRPGLRIVGYKRRVAIAFTVADDDTVVIVRVLYGGRDLSSLLGQSNRP